jgi:ribosomal protein L22
MSDEPEKIEPAAESSAPAETEPAASAEDSEPAAEPKAKPARKPRAAKAKAADEAPAQAEAEKPKRSRAAKPKPEASAADAPKAKNRQPEPKRSRTERHEPVAAPVVRAQAKYVRSSARKARLVCDNIRGKSVDDARAILAHTPRAVAQDWIKLLESAVANAEHNHELVGEDLVIKAVHADEGPTIKRFRPRAMGRATKIRKRTSHLTILLTPKN